MNVTPEHKRYATPAQAAAIDALLAEGMNATRAAKRLGVTRSTVRAFVRAVEKKAARAGYAPAQHYTHPVPEGYHVKGASQLFRRGEAEPVLTWVKSAADVEDKHAMLVEAFKSIELPAAKLVRPPTFISDEWMSAYLIGDHHLGMLAWHLETGNDYDQKIATDLLVGATRELVSTARPSKEAVILQMGDFFHSDTPLGITMRSGHNLDTDSRWAKLVRTGVHLMVTVVEHALTKHERVTVRNTVGNHDDTSATWLGLCLEAHFRNEPRVTIDTSPNPFHYVRFGVNLIGSTHGHTVKLERLPGVMASDCRKDWSETIYRRFYVGHYHQRKTFEESEVEVEVLRVLAAREAYAHAAGYRSMRDMRRDDFHVTKGPKRREIVSVEELRNEVRV